MAILKLGLLHFVVNTILGFLGESIVDLASNIGNLEAVGERSSTKVMAKVFQGVSCLCISEAILEAC
jgi:hypothetical protein